MNARVLELLKQPKNIQKEDLQVLKDEIQTFPYLQNVRALHLYGVHLYDAENYQKELSKTAAYTTDKKNLYHLINGKSEKIAEKVSVPETKVVEESKPQFPVYTQKSGGFPLRRVVPEQLASQDPQKYTEVKPQQEIGNEPVFVEGERNRILFEGEENFLNEDHKVKIDIESSLESGNLVTETATVFDEILEKNPLINEEPVLNSPSLISEEKSVETSVENLIEPQNIENSPVQEPTSEPVSENIEDVSFNQSEIKVSPQENLEEAVEFIAEDKAISFQEIEPLEVVSNGEAIEEITIAEEREEAADFTPETIIEEDKIDSVAEIDLVEDESQLSFHGTDSFLPDIKIESSNSPETSYPITNSTSVNKYEDEMRRLIEQVEQKMKESKKDEVEIESVQKIEEEKPDNFEISFAETQSFEVETPVEEISKNEMEAVENSTQEIVSQESIQEEVEEPKSAWKPMSFETNALDSTIGKINTVEVKTTAQPEIKSEPLAVEVKEEMIVEELPVEEKTEEITANSDVEIIEENTVKEQETEAENVITEVEKTEEKTPAFNVSFFGNNISTFIKEEEKEEPKVDVQSENSVQSEVSKEVSLDSNVPGFINTWQSWLKIDRPVEVDKNKIEIKVKAIDTFIETNPRISQLKDEVTFVVKEKNDDISHLMTETLARLYTEQKLYTKAIQAYKTLIGKHPEKKAYFEEKIQEVKDLRGR